MGKLMEMNTNDTNMTCPGEGWQMGRGGLVPCARRLPTRAAWFCTATAMCHRVPVCTADLPAPWEMPVTPLPAAALRSPNSSPAAGVILHNPPAALYQ